MDPDEPSGMRNATASWFLCISQKLQIICEVSDASVSCWVGKEVGGLLRLEAGVECFVVVGFHPLQSKNDGFGKKKKKKNRTKNKCCPLPIERTERVVGRNEARTRGEMKQRSVYHKNTSL